MDVHSSLKIPLKRLVLLQLKPAEPSNFFSKKKRGSLSKIVSSIFRINFCVLRLCITTIPLLSHLHLINWMSTLSTLFFHHQFTPPNSNLFNLQSLAPV